MTHELDAATAVRVLQALEDPVLVVRALRSGAAVLGAPEDFVVEWTNGAWSGLGGPAPRPDERLSAVLDGAVGAVVLEHCRRALSDGHRRTLPAVRTEAGADGRWLEHDLVPLGDDRLAVTVHDRTRLHDAETAAARRSTYDGLTGAFNRESFLRVLAEAAAHHSPSRLAAVLVCDLDHFQLVNESLGHGCGDQLLVQVAERIRSRLGPHDTMARLSGDEFAVLIDRIERVEDAVAMAEAIATAVAVPYALGDRELFAAMSIGIAIADGSHADPSNLLRDAVAAVHRAKLGGRSRFELFDDRLRADAVARLQTETDLRRALQRDQLRVFYQPEVSFRSGRVVGVEALLRWQHPKRGLLGAPDFVPLAEEAGLIIPLGDWVLEQACRQARTWSDERGEEGNILVRVNLSARQLAEPTIVAKVAGVLERTGCRTSQLCLEVTETLLMDDPELCLGRLRQLHELGVELAIDDFGTGYSSLGYLRRLPVDIVKIDQTFVWGLSGSVRDAAIVAAVVHLAFALGLDVTAEGVETVDQLDRLVRLGVRRGQGYLFGRAMPAPLVEAMFGTDVVGRLRASVA